MERPLRPPDATTFQVPSPSESSESAPHDFFDFPEEEGEDFSNRSKEIDSMSDIPMAESSGAASTATVQITPEMFTMLQGLLAEKQAAATQNTTTRPVEKLPKLPEFNGTRSEWENWYRQARYKLVKDGDVIGDDQSQFYYIFLRLRSTAAQTVQAYADQAERNGTESGKDLLDYMNTFYGDPAKEDRATAQLYTMRQRDNEPFFQFLPRFETTLANAGGTLWNDRATMTILRQAINDELKTYLVGRTACTTFAELKNYLLTISTQLSSIKIGKRAPHVNLPGTPRPRNSAGSGPPVRSPARDPNVMDWEPSPRINNVGCGCQPGTRHTCGRKRATWVDDKTRRYRREVGACLRCGNQGHIQTDCRLLPPIQPYRSQGQSPRLNNTRIELPTYDREKSKADDIEEEDIMLEDEAEN